MVRQRFQGFHICHWPLLASGAVGGGGGNRWFGTFPCCQIMRRQRWTFYCCDIAQRHKTVHVAIILVLAVNLKRNCVQNVDCVKDFNDSIFVRDVDHVFHPSLHLWEATVEGSHASIHLLGGFTLVQHGADIFYGLYRSTSEPLDPAGVHLQHEDLQGGVAPVVVAGGVAGLELLEACHLGFEVVQDSSSEELKLLLSHTKACQLFGQGRHLLIRKGETLWRKNIFLIFFWVGLSLILSSILLRKK